MDYFYNNNDTKGEYVIYAPHWAIKDIGFKYGTFEWSGQYMLNYAKSHPEIKWLFKPHPILFKTLVDTGLYTTQEAEQYYEDWEEEDSDSGWSDSDSWDSWDSDFSDWDSDW